MSSFRSLSCCLIVLALFPADVASDGDGLLGEDEAFQVVPAEFSWGDEDSYNWMTPIRNMDQCGAGTCAFPLAGAFEPRLRVAMNEPFLDVDLSEQYLISCHHGSCNGCYMGNFLNFLRDEGVPDEACFPYTGGYVDCAPCADWASRLYTIDGWSSHTTPGVEWMKAEIYNHGPVITWFDIYEDFYSYSSGVYQYVSGALLGGTQVVLYGWSDAESCWLAKNHWGTLWGETGPDGSKGWFRIRMGTDEAGCESLVFTLTPTPLNLFADGFESGSTSEWSSAVP